MSYVDLTHVFKNNMPGFKIKNPDGSYTQYTAQIRPFLTHEQSKTKYNDLCSFETTEMTFQTSIGTYIDSPYHRYPDGKDISEIALTDLILPGVIIDVRGYQPQQCVPLAIIPPQIDLSNKAVLFNFGYDQHWGHENYYSYPFLSEAIIDYLIAQKVKLVGTDTINIDDHTNLVRPAHTKLLRQEIIICENLCNLAALHHHQNFIFYALPIKAQKVAAMPVRAFAEIRE